LDILGIDKRTADAPFHSLSWGQQRLALIVRALVKHPTVLILDCFYPTSHRFHNQLRIPQIQMGQDIAAGVFRCAIAKRYARQWT
ncbi:ATP-binding cassette domain-containing protein, partial [Salmonella enterica subsp. enterica serovar Lubbock]|nr:ATP-binding cassette domain-containing protein [Salmonella enterica subsp. enterica serovar Lubbock]